MSKRLKFPLVDKEGKLYDRFPLIILHLNSGEKVKLNYFTEYAAGYVPTRYMREDTVNNSSFMPFVEYLSAFISPTWTYKEFMRHVEAANRRGGLENAIQVSNNEFVTLSNVSKVTIDEDNGDIICFGEPKWGDKRAFVEEENVHVVQENEIMVYDDSQTEVVEGRKEVNDFIDSLGKP